MGGKLTTWLRTVKNVWQQHWIMGYIIFSLLFVLASVTNYALDIGRPFGGFFAPYLITGEEFYIDTSNPEWWPVLKSGSLQHGDRLLTINGVPYNGLNQHTAFSTAHAQGQETVILEVRSRQGQERVVSIPVIPFTFPYLLDIKLPDFIFSLAFWILAIMIYRAQPKAPLNRVAAILICTVVIFERVGEHSLFWQEEWETKILASVSRIRNSFVGALLIHFALLFPMPSRFMKRSILYALYVLASFFSLSGLLSFLIIWTNNGSTDWAIWLHLTGQNYWFLTISGIVIVLLRLFWVWRQNRVPLRHRREAGLLLLGGFLGTLIVWRQFGTFLGINVNLWFVEYLDLRYLQLLIPITLAFLILRYQTFQTPPQRLLFVPILIAVSAFIANGGTAILLWTQPQLAQAQASLTLLILFLLILSASAIWYALASEWGWLGRLLHWRPLGYAAVRRFGQTVIEHQQPTKLPDTLAQTLCTELELERAAVWLWQADQQRLRLAGRAGTWHHLPPLTIKIETDEPLTSTQPLRLQTPALPHWLEPLREQPTLAVVAPLLVSGQMIGLLALGKRWDEALFNERDLEIIELIGQQSALFLLTAQQVEQLRQVPQQVTQAQERERYKISGELHDTIQQFLGRLPFYLELSRDMMDSDPQQAESILKNCIVDVADAARTVRNIRVNLAPSQLKYGLVPALLNLIDKFRLDTELDVTFDASPELDVVTSLDTRRALYRVVQQALDNIRAHAQATRVIISLEQKQQRILFSIRDDGVGASAAKIARAQANESFGLRSMEYRIKSVGGNFEFKSVPQKGTKISGWVPVKLQ